jgi:two-component system, OmpR family, heavy metal sensor histidine kinase CusS
MRSIRLSLMVYFLALLALALTAISAVAYRYAQDSLGKRQDARRQVLEAEHEKACDQERWKLDQGLLLHAKTLASQARFQMHWNQRRLQILSLAALSGAESPCGALTATFWQAKDVSRDWAEFLHRTIDTEIQFNEEVLTPNTDGGATEYFQVNLQSGFAWMSRSLRDHERRLPFDQAAFIQREPYGWKFDDFEPEPGHKVRHLSWKVPVARLRFYPPPRIRPPERRPAPRPNPERAAPADRNALAMLIQCASETSQRDKAIALLNSKLEDDVDELRAESGRDLSKLRLRLVLISLATFAATLIGGFWLVRLGLSPLHRLSEAVSRVSARDFRLNVDERRLPHELRPITTRLCQTLDLLKRAFAREKQAAADISHELRTPLAALLTTLEVGLRKPRPPEEYRELLADCHAAGQQMSQLVERLLALARLDAGVDTLRPRPIDAAQLAEQCATLVRPLAEARDLNLTVVRNGPVPIHTDPDKLREVVTNLLHNAIEYNRPKGSVELSVCRENGHLCLEVRDTGIGIKPEAREHIFERFYRADSSRHAEGLHAGLGLAIVKGYVDLMGGSLSVESQEGQGSRFRLELPVQGETTTRA